MITIKRTYISWIDFYLLPICCLSLAATIWLTDNNTNGFMWMNALGFMTNEALWANITILGDALILVSLLALFIKNRPQWLVSGLIAALLSAVIVQLMKYSLDIDRPMAILTNIQVFLVGDVPTKRAFPSGHSASVFVFASIVFICAKSRMIAVSVLLVAAIVALSRVVVAAHWPIDLLVGASIGWLSGCAGLYLTNRIKVVGRFSFTLLVLLVVLASGLLFFHKTGYQQAQILQYSIAGVMLILSAYQAYLLLFKRQKITDDTPA